MTKIFMFHIYLSKGFSNKSYLPWRIFIIISTLIELLGDGTPVEIIVFTILILSMIYSSHNLQRFYFFC